MKGYISFAFFLLLALPLVVLVPDLIVYGTLNYKASSVVAQVTKEAEMMGGITTPVQDRADELIEQYGLDGQNMNLSYSSTGKVNYRGRFSVELSGSYTFKSFNLLGTGIGEFTLPIKQGDTGFSEVWVR